MSQSTALRGILAVAAMMWAAALIFGAFLASRSEAGPIGYLISAAIYEIGSLVCHQRPERSFHIWGAQLPVCARCTGIYAGAALAAVTAVIVRVDVNRDSVVRHAKRAVFLAALPTMLTLLFEWTTGQTPGNWIRAAAGFLIGAIVAWVVMASSGPRSAVEIH
jgi:uncharacterized membrane protein